MTAGRIYTAPFTNIAITASQDLFEVVAPSTACVELLEIHLSQTNLATDADEQILQVILKSGQTTSGSGGGTITPEPLSLGDSAFGGTVERNNTTKASAGTIVTHCIWGWNVRIPFDVVYIPETTKLLSPSARLTLELATAPSTSMTTSGYLVFKEIGT